VKRRLLPADWSMQPDIASARTFSKFHINLLLERMKMVSYLLVIIETDFFTPRYEFSCIFK
jgi:hypothetical protein